MAGQAWLESSLRRTASLGREVLERASRRSVRWTSGSASQTPTTTDEDAQSRVKRASTELEDAFATFAELMAQTTHQCKIYNKSGCATDDERKHVSRFHTGTATGRTTPSQPIRKHSGLQGDVSGAGEDFYIEVSPGTYAITASVSESQQQTKMVHVRAGESIDITFDL